MFAELVASEGLSRVSFEGLLVLLFPVPVSLFDDELDVVDEEEQETEEDEEEGEKVGDFLLIFLARGFSRD